MVAGVSEAPSEVTGDDVKYVVAWNQKKRVGLIILTRPIARNGVCSATHWRIRDRICRLHTRLTFLSHLPPAIS